MDGASGSFQLVPVVVQQYNILDRRFTNHHVVPWTIGVIELFIMYPLCLVSLYCILQNHPLRFPLELITSCCHVFGAIVFVASEVYEGQRNIPALDPVGILPTGDYRYYKDDAEDNRHNNLLQFKFNLYHLTYYWFGFWFCNSIWAVVPMYRMMRAADECRLALIATNKNKMID
jgi:EXPERA (EXPanded EBP superfamily)